MSEAYEYENDYSQCADGWPSKINRIIEKEVTRRLSDRQKQIESDNDYFKAEMFKAKNELCKFQREVDGIRNDADKVVREAVRIAQREYYFNCAIGDTVYLIDHDYVPYKCDKCNNTQKIPVMIDGIEVKAECPICGTYSKRQELGRWTPKIVKGKVERLQIELTEKHKWIHIWLDNSREERKFNIDTYRVFRTMKEAQAALKEEQAKAGEANES